MRKPGPALRFLAVSTLVFGALLLIWPAVRGPWAWGFRASSEFAFQFLWFGPEVSFDPDPVQGDAFDTQIRVHEDPDWAAAVDSHGAGYFPAAVFLALVLGTPIAIRRRLRALLVGGALVYGYVVLLLVINLLDGLTRHYRECGKRTVHPDLLAEGWWREGLESVLVMVRLEPTVFVLVPVLAWIVSCFRWSDVERFLALRRAAPAAAALMFALVCSGVASGQVMTSASSQVAARGPVHGSPRPGNVLLIIADEVGTDRVGVYGEHPSAPPTPNLDSLAARGVFFRNAYAYSTCSPTRALIMTGRYGFRTGIGEVILVKQSVPALPYGEITLPELLDLGTGGAYQHALVGKWHLGSASFGAGLNALQQGWQAHYGTRGNIGDYTDWNKYVNGALEAGTVYATTDQVDDAIAFTHSLKEPWFVCLSFNGAHSPYHVPPAHLHTATLSGAPTASAPEHFDAAVEAMDTEIGRLLASMPPALKASTTILFVGDNGPPGKATKAPYTPNGSKGFLYEAGINVPLIASGYRVGAAGVESPALVSAVDLFATVAELAGFDAADALPDHRTLDSVSLVPYFQNPLRPSLRATVYAEQFSPNGAFPVSSHGRALRDERWKLIEREGATDQFYDLQGLHLEGPDLMQGTLDAEQQAAYDALKLAMSELLSS